MGRRLTRSFYSILFGMCLAAYAASLSFGGDRLGYLNEPCDPYYVGKDFPALTTPQWVGEEGVEAVVILSIDDMRDPAVYERFLRPVLNRLKQIDGRAPVSIFTCQVDPQDPRLQKWLDEGLSLEVHTVDHPCPLLQGGDFAKAKSTVERCIDAMSLIPRSKPVSFRMPCCDSQNTPSPRFWVEIFQQTTEKGNYLSLDSSVFNILTPDDPDLPREIVLNENGEERFRRYLPFPSFVNTIENYPYPYIIGHQCWQFPGVVPSDWAAQNIHQPNNPDTLRDMKLAIDATVIKQGVMSLVFHPHGWIRNDQLVELIGHAQEKHGNKVKFLTFREALERLNQHLLDGQPVRDANGDTGVRMLDIDGDGFLDVVLPAGESSFRTKIWDNGTGAWRSPNPPQESRQGIAGTRPSFFQTNDGVGVVTIDEQEHAFRSFGYDGKTWIELQHFTNMSDMPARIGKLLRRPEQIDDFRFRDLDGDGISEMLITEDGETILLGLQNGDWAPLPFGLPEETSLLTKEGSDAGLRFRDVNEDGLDDVLFSNGRHFSLHLFVSMKDGWSEEIRAGQFGDPGTIPAIVRADGTNNGAWFHSRTLWIQNEDTNRLPDLVDRLSFADMLRGSAGDNNASLPPAKSPQAALAAFQKRKGVRIELVASEPDVVDPVAFDWGPDGRLWVAEMRDYPNGITWNKQGDPLGEPGGRIKLLEDTNRDGRYDKVHVFLDNVPSPTGVKAWRKGVLVTAAPDIFYAEDTDGDGRADKREVLYTGFVEGNQQHRVNGMRWGLDQWLYLANGDSGGTVKSLKTGDEVRIGGRDLRIKPDRGLIETQSGQTQSGRVSDDHGNWFGGNNSNPVWHYALNDRYLARNPHYAPPSVRHQISVAPGAAPIFPASRTLARFNDFDRADRFTSACSPEVFREDWPIGEDFRRFIYVCEPVHNLVSRELLEDNGTTFSSRRDPNEQNQEFLASRDNWFRPVMIRTGPDGALWVADMYRLVIEHPEWIPLEWQERLNLRDGADRGRIYRVGFANIDGHHEGIREWYKLDHMDTTELVAAMDSSNGALRDMVQQLLYWRNDKTAVEPLKKLIHGARWPRASLHALYLLDALGGLDDEQLISAIQHGGGSVERHAIRLAESHFADSPKLRAIVLNRVSHRATKGIDRRAKQQLAYSLGEMNDSRVGAALAKLSLDYHDDPYIVAAVMSSVNEGNLRSLLAAVVNEPAVPAPEIISELLGMSVALDEPKVTNAALVELAKRNGVTATADKLVAMAGLVETLERRDLALDNFVDWSGLSAARLIFTAARKLAENPAAAETERIAAMTLLGNEPESAESDVQTLLALLTPRASSSLQSAAVTRLSKMGRDEIGQQVLIGWRSYAPSLRQQVMNMLLSRETWTEELLTAIENGIVLPTHIDAHRRQQLQRSKSVVIREQAEQLFTTANASSRGEVIERYREATEHAGESERGQPLFVKHCAKCHRLGGEGYVVGPDLAALSDKSTSALLVAVLDPNRAMEDKYLDYTVATDDGRLFSGLLTNETANAVTLALPEGKEQPILRNEIEELIATGKSLMPEGIEQDIPPPDMADIFAYVRSVNVPPKRFAGNNPQAAPMRDDGSIRLFAMHARIYGSTLVFEPKYRNLGFWKSANDRATWTLNVPRTGMYGVSLDYACPADCAGNRFELSAAGKTLSGEIPSTGSWDNYGWHGAGRIELPAGQVEVTLRAEGIVDGFLADFRTIILSPTR